MSIALMTDVWRTKLPMTEKMVLLCLADYANDRGECWPAVETLAAKCSCSDRTIQKALKNLERWRFLQIERVTGRSNKFRVDPRSSFTPENPSPPKITAKPPKNIHPTPENPSPKPSMNHHEPPLTANAVKRARENFVLPDWIPAEPWVGFIEMRKHAGKMPTPRGMGLLVAKLERLRKAGHDPGQVLDQSTERNWLGLFEVKENGRTNEIRQTNGSGDRRSSLARAIDEGIEFLGGSA